MTAKKSPLPQPENNKPRRGRPPKSKTPKPQATRQAPSTDSAAHPLQRNRQARIVGAFGATGTGKTTWLLKQLPTFESGETFLFFDPKHEHAHGNVQPNEPAFLGGINAGLTISTFRPSFDPDQRTRQFNRFCLAALAVARARGSVCVFVDELHLVTTPGRAAAGWGELIMTGRALGVSIYAASIRPADIDKTFFSNATLIRAHRINDANCQRVLAQCLNVTPADVAALSGFEFIERDFLLGKTTRPYTPEMPNNQ